RGTPRPAEVEGAPATPILFRAAGTVNAAIPCVRIDDHLLHALLRGMAVGPDRLPRRGPAAGAGRRGRRAEREDNRVTRPGARRDVGVARDAAFGRPSGRSESSGL